MKKRPGRMGRRFEARRPGFGIRPEYPPLKDIRKDISESLTNELIVPGLKNSRGPMLLSPGLTPEGALKYLSYGVRAGRPNSLRNIFNDMRQSQTIREMSLWESANMNLFSN